MDAPSPTPDESQQRALAIWRRSPLIGAVLDRWARLDLPDAWLVAGALAQTVWNDAFGHAPTHGIADVDIVYFDAADLSEEAEARHAQRVADLFADIPVRFDVKNQARVHLWYAAKFGFEIAPYRSAQHAIDTFPTTATSIGLQLNGATPRMHAFFGLDDMFGLIVRANKTLITQRIYEAKVQRWLLFWPKLNVIAWDE
jgi:hypothetical protein